MASIHSGAEALSRKKRRITKRDAEADISPGLRKHITRAAQRIRAAHRSELADVLKAEAAGRLFRNMIRLNGEPVGTLTEPSVVAGDGIELLATEVGGLLSDTFRAGSALLEGSLTLLTREWMTTMTGPAAKPKSRRSPARAAVPRETGQPPPSAPPPMPGTTVDTAVPGDQPAGMPAPNPEEVMLRGVFKRFMPMLVTALSQGGDGYGLAETVIALFGRPTYEQASGLGKDKIMQMVETEPDLWAQVAPIEAKFRRFVDEFTGYDAWTELQARQANGPPDPHPAGTSR